MVAIFCSHHTGIPLDIRWSVDEGGAGRIENQQIDLTQLNRVSYI